MFLHLQLYLLPLLTHLSPLTHGEGKVSVFAVCGTAAFNVDGFLLMMWNQLDGAAGGALSEATEW